MFIIVTLLKGYKTTENVVLLLKIKELYSTCHQIMFVGT